MFEKILVANRGEIACRIISSAKRMGIATVAVYSAPDRGALHVEMADEAVCIGGAAATESYLSVENLIGAIKETGAQAVHPGYGFLSENAAFAERLDKEGFVFIGPNVAAISVMGDKIESKKLAEKIGVNTIPGHTKAIESEEEAISIARRIGYPAMIKASAGGGGKGMRVVGNDEETRAGFGAASREAEASFGDGRVFMEKFIEHPRHIEIQILADGHGNVVYLGERECSIQRRHQKVIEEAPSPFMDADTRTAMGAQAVSLARAVDYRSAGTVEFIVDGDGNFYFLEMNTRLQVEHPVTEMITGMDLVEMMIRIAAGEKLPFRQDEVKLNGWSMECRIYAEDPGRNFLPSIGRLVRYREPEQTGGVRIDSGVREGDEITIHYDPLMAKLVSYGADRDQAIRVMRRALDQYLIDGVSHNLGFLAAIMAHPRFLAGNLTTGFIDEEYGDGFDLGDVPHDDPAVLVAVAAAMHFFHQQRAASPAGEDQPRPPKAEKQWVVLVGGESRPVAIDETAAGFRIAIGSAASEDRRLLQTDWRLGESLFRCRIDGTDHCLQVKPLSMGYRLKHWGTQVDVLVLDPRAAELHALMPEKKAADTSKFLLSPMPGLLVTVNGQKGQAIKAGQELAVIEAMKMENVLCAERDGIIAAVHAHPGDNLAVDQPILEFE